MFTIWNWIFVAIWLVCTLLFSIGISYINDEYIGGIINGLISIIILVFIMIGIGWYHTSTASGIRYMKDYHSELSNGIDREIIITAEDGREIFYYEGKVDIESDHVDNYIKFEGEDGKRYMIFYGIQDTVKIIEK